MSDQSSDQTNSSHRSPAEWVSFTIALFILITIVGLVTFRGLGRDSQPPILCVTVKQTDIRQVEMQYYVPFTVTNSGGRTAESVQVMAELTTAAGVQESGEQTINFLSSGEIQEGAFIFSHPPQEGDLKVRVASYKLP
ncbi:TIGR02588 family protein [Coleofasciculus chthonoplastes]|uniref:TIGR02588 family protein n=1 Tax=Coleofasciculus chthonoplastes TaxID=64178 RepID=UPI003303E342